MVPHPVAASIERVVAVLVGILGGIFLISPAALLLGFLMSESTSLGTLIGSSIVLVVVGGALLTSALVILKSPPQVH